MNFVRRKSFLPVSAQIGVIAAVSVLASCSDSFLFGPDDSPSPVLPGPGAPAPQGGVPGQGAPGAGTSPQQGPVAQQSPLTDTMVFTWDPEAASDQNPLANLFPSQSVDPFEYQSGDASVEMEVRVGGRQSQGQECGRDVRSTTTFRLKSTAGNTLVRDFSTNDSATGFVRNACSRNSSGQWVAGSQDVLEITLVPSDGRGGSIQLRGSREAANDAASMARNAWSGTVVLKGGAQTNDVTLGRFHGFLKGF